MKRAVLSYTMPFSNVSHLPLAGKLKATQVAGYTELSLMPVEVERIAATEGITPRDQRKQAEDLGIRIVRLDPLNTWPRVWRPDNMDEAYIASVDTPPDRFFAIAEAVGATQMSLNATFPMGAMALDEIVDHYIAICKRAAEHGITACDLEPIPLWGVPTLAMGWTIIERAIAAGAENAGLVFDTWHCVRSYSDIGLLRQIPGDRIHCVQLNDGLLHLPPGVTVKDDCYDRKFPGDGEFPNVEIVRVLAETGGLNGLGPEVFSPILADMSADFVGEITRRTVSGVLAAAGVADELLRA